MGLGEDLDTTRLGRKEDILRKLGSFGFTVLATREGWR